MSCNKKPVYSDLVITCRAFYGLIWYVHMFGNLWFIYKSKTTVRFINLVFFPDPWLCQVALKGNVL